MLLTRNYFHTKEEGEILLLGVQHHLRLEQIFLSLHLGLSIVQQVVFLLQKIFLNQVQV